ncbi:MAG TPA: R3H domain-containing nucleic acid-binding protein [Pseudonocardiaceae bacterium]
MSETLQGTDVMPDAAEEAAGTPVTSQTSETSATDEDVSSPDDLLVREGDIAGDYLEKLLDLLDYDGDIDLDVEAGRAVVSIDGGGDLEKLVGQRGAVLEALQELTRLAVQQETGTRSRLMLDVAGWRASRRDELSELGRSAAEQAVRTGERVKLQPMTPFERKVVHDAVATVAGAQSESEGEEPRRRVVVSAGR